MFNIELTGPKDDSDRYYLFRTHLEEAILQNERTKESVLNQLRDSPYDALKASSSNLIVSSGIDFVLAHVRLKASKMIQADRPWIEMIQWLEMTMEESLSPGELSMGAVESLLDIAVTRAYSVVVREAQKLC